MEVELHGAQIGWRIEKGCVALLRDTAFYVSTRLETRASQQIKTVVAFQFGIAVWQRFESTGQIDSVN